MTTGLRCTGILQTNGIRHIRPNSTTGFSLRPTDSATRWARARHSSYIGIGSQETSSISTAHSNVFLRQPHGPSSIAHTLFAEGRPAITSPPASTQATTERLNADLCRATVLDLAATNIEISEQSIPFIGGWGFAGGRSDSLNTIACPMNAARDPSVRAGLQAMETSMPVVKFVLMTHTSQLATLPGATQYGEWSKTGRCEAVNLPAPLRTAPATIYHGLLGEDDAGKPVVDAGGRASFYDAVIGIDTAGPETTCFTPDGMTYYGQLVAAVYDAAKARRSMGWHGKLLVHTHVGEGGVIDYAPVPPAQPWTFDNAFASLPTTLSNYGPSRAEHHGLARRGVPVRTRACGRSKLSGISPSP